MHNRFISKLQKTLGVLTPGTFQRELADRSGIQQSPLNSIMPIVWEGITQMTPMYTRFPYAAEKQANIKIQFAAIPCLSNVIGAIDCTHIAIWVPREDKVVFVN